MSTDDQPRDSETNDTSGRLSRRRMMAAGAAGWATVSLAGCSSPGGSGSGGNGDQTTAPEQTTTDVSVSQTTTTTTTGGSGGGATTTTTTSSGGNGGGGGGGGGGGKCELESVFAPGMDVGFLVSVYDNLTGSLLDDGDLATVLVSFPNARFEPVQLSVDGAHTDHVSEKWGGKLELPADAEPGTYSYDIAVQRPGEDEPTHVATDEFVLVDSSR